MPPVPAPLRPVTAALLHRDGAYLAVEKQSGLWEFPGGKAEPGETLDMCLCREIREELGLIIQDPQPVMAVDHPPYRLHFLRAALPGLPALTEHRRMGLFPPRQLLTLPMSPPDRLMARRLALQDPPIRHIVWDLDGTLLDTYPHAAAALAQTLQRHGLPVTDEAVLPRMKRSLGDAFRHYAPQAGLSVEALRIAYRAAVTPLEPHIRPIPGIPEALEALSRMGITHYLWTHRDGRTWNMLAASGLRHHFRGGITADEGFPPKPDPTGLLALLERHHLPPAATLMVGDRLIDVQGGKLAGLPTLLLKDRFVDAAHLSVEMAADAPGEVVEMMVPLVGEFD